jgi:hypothetical protein
MNISIKKALPILFLLLLQGKSALSASNIDAQILEMANQQNKKLPIMVNGYTRLDTVIPGPGAKFTYTYTILTLSSKDVNETSKQRFNAEMQPFLKNQVCSHPDYKALISNKVVVGFYYRTVDWVSISRIEISPNDCGF